MRKILMVISSFVFGVVAVLHILRVIFAVPVQIGNFSVPLWFSVCGFLATCTLSALNWKYRK